MRWLLHALLLSLAALIQGLSSAGNRLLVIIEDTTTLDKYSQLWDDLRGTRILRPKPFELLELLTGLTLDRGYTITHESPKNEKLTLLQHGVKSFDHLILFPAQSKGTKAFPWQG